MEPKAELTTAQRIALVRQLMKRNNFQAAVISGTDPHNDEYLPAHWQQRLWVSGFTGDYGTVVITADHAGLWTDTRFFVQFDQQMSGTEYHLHKLRVDNAVDWSEWIVATLPEGSRVAVDGLCTSAQTALHLGELAAAKSIEVVSVDDFIDSLWADRPPLPKGRVFELEQCYTGRSRRSKIDWLRTKLVDNGVDHIVISALDQIAWLLNIRSNDIDYNPVTIAYAVVSTDSAVLFVDPDKIDKATKEHLAQEGVETKTYDSLPAYLTSLPTEECCMYDSEKINYSIYRLIGQHFARVVDMRSPIELEKGCKNSTEIEGFRRAYVEDGVAMTRFFIWLEEQLESGAEVDEYEAATKLSKLRSEREGARGDSFGYISAYGANAAMPHYFPTAQQHTTIGHSGLYLIDSGGQYLYGTTDTTRTIPVGELTQLEREDYTLDLKAMIDLSTACFPRGTRGANIDALARIALWKAHRNFGHGTGHGVGHFLCCHEGPQDLRQNLYDQTMEVGMVTSVEPGIYRAGWHGVRHENMLLTVDDGTNEFGSWLRFETLTCCYIDPRPIVWELMTKEQIEWIEWYNGWVCDTLQPHLTDEDNEWLRRKTTTEHR